jgi:GAF domain-containing protein
MRAAEESRLQSLHSFGVLDTEPEPQFDQVASHAARACQVPYGMVSLVDRDRQFFKARIGFDAAQAPRPGSFCVQAIQKRGVFVVEDALQDPRFAQAPFVAGPPHFRFYAGVPLVASEGEAIGTLCTADTQPRSLTPSQGELLEALAQVVMLRLELRREIALRDFAARTLAGPLREELSAVCLAASALLPRPGGVSALLHAQRAEDLASDLAALHDEPLRRRPTDLVALLQGLLEALGSETRLVALGDCRGSFDADQLSVALSRLCDVSRGALRVSVEGQQGGVLLKLSGVAQGVSEPAAWLSSEEGGMPVALGRRLAHRVVLAHGGTLQVAGGLVQIWLPRSPG